MKRLTSLFLSLVLMFLAISPTTVFADTKLQRVGKVSIVVPPAGNHLEDSFREFVKQVAEEYYSGTYNLNKYYYQAADIKYEWDTGGIGGSRKNNPYSVYEEYKEHDDYNIPLIQSMLITGIQQKATNLTDFDFQDFSIGLSVDSTTGSWKIDEAALTAQAIYNKTVASNVKAACTELMSGCANALVDAAIVYGTGGNVPALAADVIDACFEVICAGITEFQKIQSEQIINDFKNKYRDGLQNSFITMYENISTVLFEDYQRLYQQLSTVPNLSSEQSDLRDQLKYLLDSIDAVNYKEKYGATHQDAVQKIADDFVDNIGLNVIPALTNKDIALSVFGSVLKTAIEQIVDVLVNSIFHDSTVLETATLNIIITDLTDIILDACNASWEDLNGDGYHSYSELGLSILYALIRPFTDSNTLKKVSGLIANLRLDYLKEPTVTALQNKLDEAFKNWSSVFKEFKSHEYGINHFNDNALSQMLKDADDNLETAQKNLEEELNKATGIGVLINDIVSLSIDLLSLAKESAGIGDIADNEVYFAHLAALMYHTKELAEARRDSLDKEYAALKDPTAIDTADIQLLFDYVSRIYGIYDSDLQGHGYYLSLATGWQYQDTQQYYDAMELFDQTQQALQQKYGTAGQVLLNLGGGWMLYPICTLVGISKSEYLEAVNKAHGWLSHEEATEKYNAIGEFVSRSMIPSYFDVLFEKND